MDCEELQKKTLKSSHVELYVTSDERDLFERLP